MPVLAPERAGVEPARPPLRSLSFLVLVIFPIAVTAAYYFAVASDQYVAEFRFTLNSVDPPRFGRGKPMPSAKEANPIVES